MHSSRHPIFTLLSFLIISLCCFSATTVSVEGVVRDTTGAVLVGATVNLQSGSFRAEVKTDGSGRFLFAALPNASGTVEATAKGFITARQPWNADGKFALHLEIVLRPSSTDERVIVSAARTEVRLSETPGSAILLSTADLAATLALRVDDVLRQVPGFSLFRRSGSRTANASLQGVSLRGLGGTASSRALVLVDGIALVDPFGGWVYWDRIPRVALSSVEVFRGGASNLYGSEALGGVVQLLTRQPEIPALSLETSYGNERTPELSFWTGTRAGKWDFSLTTEMFRTGGFILVPESARRSVDVPANSEDVTIYARIGHTLGNDGRVFAQGNFYTEFRQNGTPVQSNDTRIGEGAVGLDKQFGANNSLTMRLYGDVEAYNQTFSAVAPDRNSEMLTDLQHVPEQVGAGGIQWAHLLGKSQTLIAGVDLNEVIGLSNEQLFSGLFKSRIGGGRQRTLGIFGEDILHLRQKWTIIVGARFDDWQNFNGSLITVPASQPPVATLYPSRNETAFSPRLSVLRSVNKHLSVTGSIYRAFRAPTLNELYRTFRIGNVLTNNNASLQAERLTGAEAGVNLTGWNRRVDVRGVFFWSDIVNPVENVTISSTPSLITRQKENLGRTRSRGVELDGVVHVNRDIQISAGYAYTAARVVSYPGNPGAINLVGLEVPQVPRNVFTWEASYWNPSRLLLSVQEHFAGRQFDDDQNQFPLDRAYTMDLEVGRALARSVEIFAAAENFLNRRYEVGRTPTVTLGPPILFRVGLRWNRPATN